MEEKDPMMEMVAKTVVVAVAFMFMAPYIQQVLAGSIPPTAAQAVRFLSAQAYQGKADPRVLNATSELGWIDLIHDYPYTPWISAYFINDGPDTVEVAINYPNDRFTINSGETVTVNRSGAQEKIAIIFFKCAEGETASVRVTGEF